VRQVVSLAFWGFIAVSSLLLFPVALLIWLVTAPFDRRLRVVANHQSFLDILVMFRLFRHFKWVSKAEMFRIPCIGWNMALNRYVKLRRGSAASIAQMMAACERHLADGSSIMIFPEGTRSADGRLKGFKHGAFTLAQKARVPILPIVVEGTFDALPKHGFVLRGFHAIRVRILPEIPLERVVDRPLEDLVQEVRARFARELGEPASDVMPAPAALTAESPAR
jgi:1-acyl-sn-glycerol-3-phosphate acyltransferase